MHKLECWFYNLSVLEAVFVSEANLQDPPVRQSVRYLFKKNLVRTTPPKRLDGLSWNLQGIFLKVSSCAPDKNFYRQSVSKSVSHQNQKILSGQLLLNGWSWNLQGIFLRVSSCAPDKNFWCLSVSKSVIHINEKKFCH